MRDAVLIPLTYALLAFLSAVVFFEVVYDDSYDALSSGMSAGQFSDFPLFDQHYLGLLLTRDVYKMAQAVLPQVNVFASMYILSSVFSLHYTLHTIKKFIGGSTHPVILHMVYALVALLFVENIVSITHTRFATVFAGMALVNMAWGTMNRRCMAIHFALFLFGMLTRPESAIGMLMVVGMAHLIHKWKLLSTLRRFAAPALSIILLVSVFYVHRAHTSRFEIKIEPDTEYALSTGRVVPLSDMNDEADSLRYQMAAYGMFIDTSFVSIDFLRGIQSGFSVPQVGALWKSMMNVIDLHLYYPVYLAALLVLIFLSIGSGRSRTAWKLLALQVSVFLLMVVLDHGVNMADRHFSGMQQVTLVILLLFFFHDRASRPYGKNMWAALSVLLLVGSVGISLANGLGNQRQVADEVRCQETAMEQIDSGFHGRTVIFTLGTFHLADRRYSFLNRNYSNNRYIMYDLSNYSIVPRNLDYLSRLCACDATDPDGFLRWMEQEEVIIISLPERYALMEKYMDMVHGRQVRFRRVLTDEEAVPPCLQGSVHDGYVIATVHSLEP